MNWIGLLLFCIKLQTNDYNHTTSIIFYISDVSTVHDEMINDEMLFVGLLPEYRLTGNAFFVG